MNVTRNLRSVTSRFLEATPTECLIISLCLLSVLLPAIASGLGQMTHRSLSTEALIEVVPTSASSRDQAPISPQTADPPLPWLDIVEKSLHAIGTYWFITTALFNLCVLWLIAFSGSHARLCYCLAVVVIGGLFCVVGWYIWNPLCTLGKVVVTFGHIACCTHEVYRLGLRRLARRVRTTLRISRDIRVVSGQVPQVVELGDPGITCNRKIDSSGR